MTRCYTGKLGTDALHRTSSLDRRRRNGLTSQLRSTHIFVSTYRSDTTLAALPGSLRPVASVFELIASCVTVRREFITLAAWHGMHVIATIPERCTVCLRAL